MDMLIISILCFIITIKCQLNYFANICENSIKEVDKLGSGPGNIFILYLYYNILGRISHNLKWLFNSN